MNYLSPNNLEQRIEALALMKGDAKNKDYEVEEEPIPAMSGLIEHEVNTREGMNADLTCMNIGTMPGNTQAVWSRQDGRDIDRRHKRTEGVLHIRGAKRSDAGKYVCQLVTTQGNVIFQLVANLVIQGIIYISSYICRSTHYYISNIIYLNIVTLRLSR